MKTGRIDAPIGPRAIGASDQLERLSIRCSFPKLPAVAVGKELPAMACTILIVDDSKFSRGRIRSALQPMDCALLEAADGQEALNSVEAHSLDLIITDLLMPHLDGFGLLRGLREQGSTIPVIVAGADVQSSSRRLCEELGVSLFLEKPFAPQNLLSVVQSALGPAMLVS